MTIKFSIFLLLLISLKQFIIAHPAVVVVNENQITTQDEDGLNPEEIGGYFEGDMILNQEQMSALLYSNKRNGLINEKFRWPGNIVFYEIDSTFGEGHVNQIKRGLKEIEKVSCIRFAPKTETTKDYIYVTGEPTGCHSAIGHNGKKQLLNLQKYTIGVGCFKLGTIVHEFIHALGFYHQQSASNRDDYVTIIKENIKDGKEHNFNKYPATIITDFGVEYDYGSIMHYSATAFTKNGKMTIVPHDKNAKIGQRVAMSPSDIQKINLMYKCPGY